MSLVIDFLGKTFEHPFVLASGPPTANADLISRAFEAGWAGAVVKTLIREPVRNLHNRFAAYRVAGTLIGFENIELVSDRAPDDWFRDIRILKNRFPGKRVIGSIMGDARDPGPWLELANGCADAGADLLELNFSCPHGHPEKGKGAAIGQNADYAAAITRWVKDGLRVPLPVVPKLTAAVADLSHIGESVAGAGADGLCAINTLPSIMGMDLRRLEPLPSVNGCSTFGGYSGPGLKPLALRAVAQLAKSPGLPLMASGGISSGFDAAEFLLAGAALAQVCTAVMVRGFGIVREMTAQLEEFLDWHGFASPRDALGLALPKLRPFGELDAAYRATAVVDPGRCTGCGACVMACRDAAASAIRLQGGRAQVEPAACIGCSLCVHVCPADAIRLV
jgi:dihydropyrimidine dehydrogenase (NAD+) subunit PreA